MSPSDAEAFRRRTKISAGRQPTFSAGQGNVTAGMANNEYLMVLARQHQNQATAQQNQPAAQILGGQHSQHSQGVPPGAQVSQVQATQQALAHTQQQPQRGQNPQAGSMARRQSPAMPHQNMAVPGSTAMNNMMMGDAAAAAANVENPNRRAMAVAALVARASLAGVENPQERIRNLTPEQVSHFLAVTAGQRGLNFGNAGNASAPNAAAATQNMGNWMGQLGNGTAARGGTAPVRQSHPLSQALAFEKQKKLQEARQQQLQNAASTPPVAAGAQGKRGIHTVAGNAAAAGVTVNQMTAIMAKEKAKIDKTGGTQQQRNATLAEAFHAVTRGRASQPVHGAGQMQIANGSTVSGATAAAAAAAVSAGVVSSGMPNGQRAPVTGSGGDSEFWIKLENMQAKYKQSLLKLFPMIRCLQASQPADKQELFMKHLKDCFNILHFERSATIPPRLTTVVLDRAERFIHQVVCVYSKYVKDVMNKSTTDPDRRAEFAAQLVDCTGVVPGAQPGQTAQGKRVNPQVGAQVGKQDAALPQGVSSQMDPQQQQFARFHPQQAQLEKLKQVHLQQKHHAAQPGAPQQPLRSGQAQGTSPVEGAAGFPQHAQPQAPRPISATVQGTGSESSKAAGKGLGGKGSGRGRTPGTKTGRHAQGLPAGRGTIPAAMQTQARTQAQMQVQVAAQVQVQQAAAAAVAQAQAQAMASQLAAAQATASQHAAAQAQALTQRQVAQSRVHLHAQQTAQRVMQNRNKLNQVRHPQVGRYPTQPSVSHGMRNGVANGVASAWNGQHAGQAGGIVNGVTPGAPSAGAGRKRQEMTIQQRVQVVEVTVKEAVEQSQRLEGYVDTEMKRAKSERIQNTLAALRNNASVKAALAAKGKGAKRQASLVDVDNFGERDGVIKSKTVFECSSEAGLRLAKKPKNEAQDLKSLREAVEADCKAAQERNPLLLIEIIEEFGQPVVTCLLRITEIKLPKLVLRVQRGYPRKGGATYGFERPPMGWVGVLDEIRSRFKRALATAPAASVGVAAFLDAWAREADAVINGSHLSENR